MSSTCRPRRYGWTTWTWSTTAPAPRLPKAQNITLNLAGVSYTLPRGDTLELQVSSSSNSFVPNRGSAVVTIANGKVAVPTL